MSKPRMKFSDNVAKLIHLLDLNEQKRLLVLCFSAIAMSALEALGSRLRLSLHERSEQPIQSRL